MKNESYQYPYDIQCIKDYKEYKVSKNRNQRKLIAAVAAKTNMHFFFFY